MARRYSGSLWFAPGTRLIPFSPFSCRCLNESAFSRSRERMSVRINRGFITIASPVMVNSRRCRALLHRSQASTLGSSSYCTDPQLTGPASQSAQLGIAGRGCGTAPRRLAMHGLEQRDRHRSAGALHKQHAAAARRTLRFSCHFPSRCRRRRRAHIWVFCFPAPACPQCSWFCVPSLGAAFHCFSRPREFTAYLTSASPQRTNCWLWRTCKTATLRHGTEGRPSIERLPSRIRAQHHLNHSRRLRNNDHCSRRTAPTRIAQGALQVQ
jgi:hypothetical protein